MVVVHVGVLAGVFEPSRCGLIARRARLDRHGAGSIPHSYGSGNPPQTGEANLTGDRCGESCPPSWVELEILYLRIGGTGWKEALSEHDQVVALLRRPTL